MGTWVYRCIVSVYRWFAPRRRESGWTVSKRPLDLVRR
jgi:hypothetical protein